MTSLEKAVLRQCEVGSIGIATVEALYKKKKIGKECYEKALEILNQNEDSNF